MTQKNKSIADENMQPKPDALLEDIADYVLYGEVNKKETLSTARYALMDSIGCAMLALGFPECCKLLGPLVPGTHVPVGARVLGTDYHLDPMKAAFDNGALIRWLDYNDTWLAAEWGHPSDNLGAILSVTDYVSAQNIAHGKAPLTVHDILMAMIKAYEIQGVLALENSFNQVGLDHVVLVKVASTAVVSGLLGSTRAQIINALSLAWVDGQSLRTYRHAPNTGTRKSWAAGDATRRGVELAWMAQRGEMGYPSALSAKTWGFCDVLFGGKPLKVSQPFGTYVMDNILFKIAYPAEFHAQTAVEAALTLHPEINPKLNQIEKIVLTTQSPAVRIIRKTGPLHNPADRDHCLQYMVAVALLFGELTAQHYEDSVASDTRIDALREKMQVVEDPQFSQDYLDPDKRAIPNAVQVFFEDGSHTEKVQIDYPLGHHRRRDEGLPLLEAKFKHNISTRLPEARATAVRSLFDDPVALDHKTVNEFMEMLVI